MWVTSGERTFGDQLLATGVLVLATNLFNLLDLRPGRSVKAFVLLGAALMIGEGELHTFEHLGLFIGPLLVAGVFDLRERAMLGDTGSNLIGALAGLWLVLVLRYDRADRRPRRAGADHRLRRIPLNFRASWTGRPAFLT